MNCAILDDYQNVALKFAQWNRLPDSIRVRTYSNHFDSEAVLADAVQDCEIIIMMRERTPLPAQHSLRKLRNVLCTPHLGYVTESNYRLYFEGAVENIQGFLAGKLIRELRG